jgi:dolichyl-phosphate beta-glucosyltransferase
MDLSIVIPAFEESKKIARDIEQAAGFLTSHNISGEIIIVDDGSKDNTSETAKNADIPGDVELHVIRYEPHRGKGFAVRKGIEKTSGDYVMFADSGSCVPYKDTLAGLDLIKRGQCDIAHGSRKTSGRNIGKHQSFHRRFCSNIFHWFIVHDLKIPEELADTQCGFKIYKGDIARHLYSECRIDGFVFDIEIIMLALKEGYRIKEFPINWTCDPDTRLSPSRSSWQIFKDLIKIRKNIKNMKVSKIPLSLFIC